MVIATLAMSAGISGANFWIPVYLICVKLDPLITFWLALITMIFGFGSGVVDNSNTSSSVLVFVLPSVVIVGQIGPRVIKDVNTDHLKVHISLILIFVSLLIFSRLWL